MAQSGFVVIIELQSTRLQWLISTYLLLRVEELFAAWQVTRLQTKLDISQAYLQLKLDYKSAELVTINTHNGLLSTTNYYLVWHQPQVCFRDA